MNLYTCILQFDGGTFVEQVEAEKLEDVLDKWLEGLRASPLDDEDMGEVPGGVKTVMDYLNSRSTCHLTFDEQVNFERNHGEELIFLRNSKNVWAAFFTIRMTDRDCDEGVSNCVACEDTDLAELVVVKTA